MVGASGAISGVMGAYLVLFPRVRVYTMVPLGFFFTTMALPAWVMLIYWMAAPVLRRRSRTVGGGGRRRRVLGAHRRLRRRRRPRASSSPATRSRLHTGARGSDVAVTAR